MDLKIIAIVLLASLAFAGAVFAVPGLHAGLDNWLGRNASMNGTWHGCGPMQNGSNMPCGFGPGNGSLHNAAWFGRGSGNAPVRANATEISAFRQAVLDNDYQAAKQLHDEYGLGGPFFERLNETTFADYSEMSNLANKLRQELGIGNQTISGRTHAGAGFAGRMHNPPRGKPQITSND
jgi:hypothetical protein